MYVVIKYRGRGLWCLTSLSTIFHLYHGDTLSNIKKYDFLKLNITLKKTLNEKKSYSKMYVTTNRSKVDT